MVLKHSKKRITLNYVLIINNISLITNKNILFAAFPEVHQQQHAPSDLQIHLFILIHFQNNLILIVYNIQQNKIEITKSTSNGFLSSETFS